MNRPRRLFIILSLSAIMLPDIFILDMSALFPYFSHATVKKCAETKISQNSQEKGMSILFFTV